MMSIKVGLCLLERKLQKMKFSEVIRECALNGIEMKLIDMEKEIEDQGPFDVILHKVLDFSEEGIASGIEKTAKLKKYVVNNPSVKIIDSIELSEHIADRIAMTEMLRACQFTVDGISVFVPKSVMIENGKSPKEVNEILKHEGIKFPILAKPVDAQCNHEAHNLMLVFSEDHLSEISLPSLIQEFCNHGGVLYKIFLVGDSFRVCQRPSIKNFTSSTQPSISFDTRKISKTGQPYDPKLHTADPQVIEWKSCDDENTLLNVSVTREIVQRLRRVIGVSLVGIDIIIEEGTGNYGIIDMNYFPGYDGVRKHFNSDLIGFLKQVAKQ